VSGGDSFDSLLDCKVVSTLFLERHGYKNMELTGKSINFMFPGIETLLSGSKSNWVSSICCIFYLNGGLSFARELHAGWFWSRLYCLGFPEVSYKNGKNLPTGVKAILTNI
jgi:hypothetical protein